MTENLVFGRAKHQKVYQVYRVKGLSGCKGRHAVGVQNFERNAGFARAELDNLINPIDF